MEGKLRAHQTHSVKVKETYQKLTGMYIQLRDEYFAFPKPCELRYAFWSVLPAMAFFGYHGIWAGRPDLRRGVCSTMDSAYVL
jgi:hypothetical protein